MAEHTPIADEDLGATILRCRPLSPMKWASAQVGALTAYLFMPLVWLPFLAMIPAAGALLLVEAAPQWAKITVIAACFFPTYLFLAWLLYLHPRGDHLILHVHGFQLKITFKQHRVLFRELRSICIEELAGGAMSLHYQDGSTAVFKQFLNRFEPEDLHQFISYVAEHQPQLRPSEQTENKVGIRWPSLGVIAFVITCLVVIGYLSVLGTNNAVPSNTTFVVEAGEPRLVRLPIKQGEWLTLSISVTDGVAVDVFIVPGEHRIADRPEAEQVREFQRKLQWQESEPVVVVIMANGTSEVSLHAEVTRDP